MKKTCLFRAAARVRQTAGMTLALAVIGSSGCHHAAQNRNLAGRSFYKILGTEEAAPGSAWPKIAQDQDEPAEFQHFFPAIPKPGVRRPVYPEAALAANLGDVVVYVRLEINSSGQVADVSYSLRGVTLPNRFSEQFFAAIRVAATAWEFKPARIEYIGSTTEGGQTIRRLLRTEAIADTLDVQFTFTASGLVR